GGVCRSVGRRRPGVPDRLAHDGGPGGHQQGSTPFWHALCLLRSCSASVDANAEWPSLSIATKKIQAPSGGAIAPSRAVRPGLSIGVGGRPRTSWVLYG